VVLYTTPSEEWGSGEILGRPNNRATPKRSGPEIKDEINSATDGSLERLRCGIIRKMS